MDLLFEFRIRRSGDLKATRGEIPPSYMTGRVRRDDGRGARSQRSICFFLISLAVLFAASWKVPFFTL